MDIANNKMPGRALLILLGLFCLPALAEAPSLRVSPKQCISLHQGQMCYQTLNFEWQTATDDDFCLWADNSSEPLLCWFGQERQSLTLEFASEESVVFSLRRRGEDQNLTQVIVELASVYRAPRRSTSSWRLF